LRAVASGLMIEKVRSVMGQGDSRRGRKKVRAYSGRACMRQGGPFQT
jgi:hypothetical protein